MGSMRATFSNIVETFEIPAAFMDTEFEEMTGEARATMNEASQAVRVERLKSVRLAESQSAKLTESSLGTPASRRDSCIPAAPIKLKTPYCSILGFLLQMLLLIPTYLVWLVFYVVLYPWRKPMRLLRGCGGPRYVTVAQQRTLKVPGLSCAELIAEVPLTLISRMLFKQGTKAVQTLLYVHGIIISSTGGKKKKKDTGALEKWSPVYPKRLARSRPEMFVNLIIGPRWNTGALLAETSCYAQRRISVDVAYANKAADLWFLIGYQSGNTVFKLSGGLGKQGREALLAGRSEHTPQWEKIDLVDAGRYTLACRYYGTDGTSTYPEVKADGEVAIMASALNYSSDDFFCAVQSFTTPFYYALAWHLYTIVSVYQHSHPEYVRACFLPSGNPDTGFRYGTIEKGSCLRLCPSEDFWDRVFLIHVSVYTRASIAQHWETIPHGTTEYVTTSFAEDGFYLVRVILDPDPHGRATNPGKVRSAFYGGSVGTLNPTKTAPRISTDDLGIFCAFPVTIEAASNASSDLEAGPSHGGGSSGGELVLPAEAHAANVAAANAKQRA